MFRSQANLPKLMPNLGLVIVPPEDVLNQTDSEALEDLSITTHRLVSDLSIVGDMYAKETDIVQATGIEGKVKD